MQRILFSLIALALIAGCATHRRRQPRVPIGNTATIKLAEAADSISESLLELQRIQREATPPMRKHLPQTQSVDLLQHASIDWSGPIEPVLRRIGHASNFRLRVLGKEPAVPVLVDISAHDSTYADIIRDLDYQAGQRASVHVYPQFRVIELRYEKA